LGQHTRAVLESIGYSADRLAALAADGVIKEG
jgi:crotonobetainyl-CoA:carnitine CoA-transferase CaiB-like acyl-CoA transferase